MNKKSVKSLILTILCAILILLAGYAGIVKGGRLLLNSEEEPQKAEFENTTSNVFYGKIEDDIELFPWNYYGKNEITDSVEWMMGYPENEELQRVEQIVETMEAYCCDVDLETIQNVYEQKQSGIMDNVKMSETEYGIIFFYQETVLIKGVPYQIKAAFDEWEIYSFSCIEYREEDVRGTPEWEQGKELLAETLEQYQYEMINQVCGLDLIHYVVMCEETGYGKNEVNSEKRSEYIADNYVICMESMEGMLKAVKNGESYSENVEEENIWLDYGTIGDIENYSCQIIELKDMILVLIQGQDSVSGVLYDPIKQKFCGYNCFM